MLHNLGLVDPRRTFFAQMQKAKVTFAGGVIISGCCSWLGLLRFNENFTAQIPDLNLKMSWNAQCRIRSPNIWPDLTMALVTEYVSSLSRRVKNITVNQL